MTILAGEDVTADALNDEIEPLARGVIAWANRQTTSTGTTTTTGVGVLRIDDVPITGGRAYRVWSNPLGCFSTVANDDVGVRFRYTTDGSTPTTSSASLSGAITQNRVLSTTNGMFQVIDALYYPAANETLSILLNVYRVAGTGTVTLFASASFPMNIYITDVGLAVVDSGVDV